MFRVPASVCKLSGRWGVVQDNGVMRRTYPASNGFYLFSEAGVGVKPLALIGTVDEILEFLISRQGSGIENRIGALPDIYMKVVPVRTNARFVGLFPFHRFMKQIVDAVANMVPGSPLTDLAGAAKDLRDVGKLLDKGPYRDALDRSKTNGRPLAPNTVGVFWHYLEDPAFTKIGAGRVGFDALYAYTEGQVLAAIGA